MLHFVSRINLQEIVNIISECLRKEKDPICKACQGATLHMERAIQFYANTIRDALDYEETQFPRAKWFEIHQVPCMGTTEDNEKRTIGIIIGHTNNDNTQVKRTKFDPTEMPLLSIDEPFEYFCPRAQNLCFFDNVASVFVISPHTYLSIGLVR